MTWRHYEAADSFREAATLTDNQNERDLLGKRAEECLAAMSTTP